MQFNDKELTKLIEDVEKEFNAHLAKAEENFKLAKSEEANSAAPKVDEPVTETKVEEQPLVKAEEEKKEEKKEDKPEEKKEESAEKPAEEAAAKPAEDKQEAPKEDAPKAEEKPAEEAKCGEDGCDYDEEDFEHMHKMYASMSKGELKAHHDAVRKALDSQGMAKCGEMEMKKAEETVEVKAEAVQPETKEVELLKSELETQKAKAEELKKNLDAVSEFLSKLVKKTAPAGKAITSLDVITKSEDIKEEKELTKSEITSILAKKAADPSLSKSDREAINAYYLNGASINSISHLLK